MFSLLPDSPKRGEGLEMKLIIDHAYVRKPPSDSNNTVFSELPGR